MKGLELQKRWSNVVFAGLFIAALLMFGRIMLPFVRPVLLGGFLVVLFLPAHHRICLALGRRGALAAALSTLAILLLIVIPLGAIAFFVGREILGVYDALKGALDDPHLRARLAQKIPLALQAYVLPPPGASVQSHSAVAAAMSGGATLLGGILGAGTALAIDVFLMAVSMYYFFIDGRRLYAEAARLVPIDRRYLDAFAKEFKDVATAVMYGNTLTAAAQGALGFVGLVVAGVPHAAMWAGAMAAVAIIPVGGTALVWAPVAVALVLAGKVSQGLFLLAWGALVVSTVDNLLRPRLCSSRMALHPLLVFLSMFGGLAVFGMMGLLIGPLVAAIFMAMVRIYRRDFLGITTPALEAGRALADPAAVDAARAEPTVQHLPQAS